MKDETARIAIRILGDRIENLEEKAIVSYHCLKCKRRTAHEHLFVKVKNGKYYEIPAELYVCTGLRIRPGRRCLSCGAVYVPMGAAEVQLEQPEGSK